MRIYIAGRFEDQLRLRPFRDILWSMGHEVVSSWLDEIAHLSHMSDAVFRRKLAIKDLGEVRAADLLILDLLGEKSSGKNIEFGAAVASVTPKLVYIVGNLTSTFHTLADNHFKDWNLCLNFIRVEHASHSTGPSASERERRAGVGPELTVYGARTS